MQLDYHGVNLFVTGIVILLVAALAFLFFHTKKIKK